MLVYVLMEPELCLAVSVGTLVQGIAINPKWTCCLICREVLVSQQLSGDLIGVLEVVKTVNFIKARPLKARLF